MTSLGRLKKKKNNNNNLNHALGSVKKKNNNQRVVLTIKIWTLDLSNISEYYSQNTTHSGPFLLGGGGECVGVSQICRYTLLDD